jgi:hypothetical protein
LGEKAKANKDYYNYKKGSRSIGALLKNPHTMGKPIVSRNSNPYSPKFEGLRHQNNVSESVSWVFADKDSQTKKTWCQIQGHHDGGQIMTYKSLYEQFTKRPPVRYGVLNCVDISATDNEYMLHHIRWVPHLKDCLLRSTVKRSANVFPLLRDKLYWVLCGGSGATTTLHMDMLPTMVEMIQGKKLWGLVEECAENMEVRKTWKETDGLSKFTKVVLVVLEKHQKLIQRAKTFHVVYSINDSVAIGCHFLFGRDLKNTAVGVTHCLEYDGLTNDEILIPELKLLFHKLVEVAKVLLFLKADPKGN